MPCCFKSGGFSESNIFCFETEIPTRFSHSASCDNSVSGTQDFLILFGQLHEDLSCTCTANILSILDSQDYTTLYLESDLDTYSSTSKFPEVPLLGSTAFQISQKVFLLRKSAVYTIENRLFFTVGQTFPKYGERDSSRWIRRFCRSFERQSPVDAPVDVILSHASMSPLCQYSPCHFPFIEPLQRFHSYVISNVPYTVWISSAGANKVHSDLNSACVYRVEHGNGPPGIQREDLAKHLTIIKRNGNSIEEGPVEDSYAPELSHLMVGKHALMFSRVLRIALNSHVKRNSVTILSGGGFLRSNVDMTNIRVFPIRRSSRDKRFFERLDRVAAQRRHMEAKKSLQRAAREQRIGLTEHEADELLLRAKAASGGLNGICLEELAIRDPVNAVKAFHSINNTATIPCMKSDSEEPSSSTTIDSASLHWDSDDDVVTIIPPHVKERSHMVKKPRYSITIPGKNLQSPSISSDFTLERTTSSSESADSIISISTNTSSNESLSSGHTRSILRQTHSSENSSSSISDNTAETGRRVSLSTPTPIKRVERKKHKKHHKKKHKKRSTDSDEASDYTFLCHSTDGEDKRHIRRKTKRSQSVVSNQKEGSKKVKFTSQVDLPSVRSLERSDGSIRVPQFTFDDEEEIPQEQVRIVSGVEKLSI